MQESSVVFEVERNGNDINIALCGFILMNVVVVAAVDNAVLVVIVGFSIGQQVRAHELLP